MRFLVTGSAGFIGFHLAAELLKAGHTVVGIDGFTPYYDVTLKEARTEVLSRLPGFTLRRLRLEDSESLDQVFAEYDFDIVVHLAAQAGVRYSIENPRAYVDANLIGTFNVLEAIQKKPIRHFLLASSSSVYGVSPTIPFRESDPADHPLTLYAASKKANEGMAHSYSHLWNIPATAFRLFTVYGPWGRPDMALFKFTKGVLEGAPIDLYNFGEMQRDFTYVTDAVQSIIDLAHRAPERSGSADDPSGSPIAPFRVVNIGAGRPIALMALIKAIEAATGRTAVLNLMDMQNGDVPRTYASLDVLQRLTGRTPSTLVPDGVAAFVSWYRDYYGE